MQFIGLKALQGLRFVSMYSDTVYGSYRIPGNFECVYTFFLQQSGRFDGLRNVLSLDLPNYLQ
jgi:hypothetical protein